MKSNGTKSVALLFIIGNIDRLVLMWEDPMGPLYTPTYVPRYRYDRPYTRPHSLATQYVRNALQARDFVMGKVSILVCKHEFALLFKNTNSLVRQKCDTSDVTDGPTGFLP